MTRRQILLSVLGVACWAGCRSRESATNGAADVDEDKLARRRAEMVKSQLAARDITNPGVLEAMGRVPRHRFVMAGWEESAYDDRALPIRHGQTISQPYIVALMTQLADPRPGDRVLDIGTGSGYQAAVLAEMGAEVASIEIVEALADEARARLAELKVQRVEVRAGDGYRGWPEKAPFQAIVLAAAAPQVPEPLIEQLAPGGRLIIPVDAGGPGHQDLLRITKRPDGTLQRETIAPVAFVPMTGEVRKPLP